jgi:hypothetical protein
VYIQGQETYGNKSGTMAEISHYIQAKRKLEVIKQIPSYLNYITLGEEICVAMYFQGYCTIKYGSWPKHIWMRISLKGHREEIEEK